MSSLVQRIEWAVDAEPLGAFVPAFALPEKAIVHARITADGVHGYGYAYCWHSGVAGSIRLLGLEMSKRLVGRDAFSWGAELRRELNREYVNFLGNEGLAAIVVSALDIAFWDWRCRALDVPLEHLIGRARGPAACYVSDALWPNVPAESCAELAAAFVQRGYRAIKLWVGSHDLGLEVRRVHAVREAVGPDTVVLVDANQTYQPRQAIALAEQLAPLDIGWLEDPVDKDDFDGLAHVCEHAPVPIASGENVWGATGVRRLLESASLDYALIDLQRIGGISGWLQAAALCDTAGVALTTHTFAYAGARLLAGTPPGQGYVEHMPMLTSFFGEIGLEHGSLIAPPTSAASPEPCRSLDWWEVGGATAP